MDSDQISKPEGKKSQDLEVVVRGLQQKLDEANVINQAMWTLLVEISRRLQVSSAAIKAAVSSLLGYDIFWDGSTQHELLEIIDNSADQVSDQITLLSLTFRSESESLELKPEPNEIQEILSYVLDNISQRFPEVKLDVEMASDGHPVMVDYEYLSVGLRLLFEVLADTSKGLHRISVGVTESQDAWLINISGMNNEVMEYLSTIASKCSTDEVMQETRLVAINKLKLHVMCRIFSEQSIYFEPQTELENHTGIRLTIPIAERG
jgi:light-regulated signal transduction histidine kinase (bacteriophytochrome)